MRLQQLLAALAVAALPGAGLAFDPCDTIFKDTTQFAERARSMAIGRAPMKHRDMASSIRLVVDVPDTYLIPFATEQQGTKIVVLPAPFARLACQMSLATYLKLEGVQPQAFQRAAGTAAACIDAGRPKRACLLAFGDDLAGRYRSAFAQLSERSRGVAMGLSTSALWQIAQHEYAHHYLDHVTRLDAGQISRIDAEFEADLYAITNGVQTGEAVSAMYYFFDGLADIEDATHKLATPDYESGACRAGNVNNITAFIGIAPLLLLDAAGGGGALLQTNSPALLRQYLGKFFGGPAPVLKAGSCGLIARVALHEIHAELKRLATRIEVDADMLFSKDKNLDNARATRLVRDLAAMTGQFRYADGIASKSIAYMLRGWGLKGRGRTPLMGEVDRLFESRQVIGNMQSEDYGRIRAAQALAVLQERSDLPAQNRLESSSRLLRDAVAHNPRISEAWMNLAFIAFKRGDCAAAARHADNSTATFTGADKAGREGVEFFARKMKQWSSNAAACRQEALKFHPYDGL